MTEGKNRHPRFWRTLVGLVSVVRGWIVVQQNQRKRERVREGGRLIEREREIQRDRAERERER